MSTPWERAHQRLLATLPVRTHSQREELLAAAGDRRGGQSIPAAHKAGRPILYHGRKYPSISAAARMLKVHPRQIYEWLRAGAATFASNRSTTHRRSA